MWVIVVLRIFELIRFESIEKTQEYEKQLLQFQKHLEILKSQRLRLLVPRIKA